MQTYLNTTTSKKWPSALKLRSLIFFLSSFLAYAQLENPLIGRLTVNDGLPNDNVFAIVQDQEGYLWVGTENGLARYDGVGFSVFQHDHTDPDSISSDDILCMLTDKEGMIWIGAFGGGLNRLDPKELTFQRFTRNPGDPNSLSHSNVNTLFEDSQSRLWVGTDGGGLDLLNEKQGSFTHFRFGPINQIHPRNQILSIAENYDGKLWVGSNQGLAILNVDTGDWEPFQPFHATEIDLNATRIASLYLDPSTRDLWVGTHQGIYRHRQGSDLPEPIIYRRENRERNGLSDNRVNVVFRDGLGTLWAGTGGDGLNRYNLEKDSFLQWRHQSMGGTHLNDIRSIYQDRTSIIWVGDRGQGLMKIDRKPAKFLVYRKGKGPYGLSDQTVNAVITDPSENLWVGCEDGLNYINHLKQTVTSYHHVDKTPESLPDDEVTALSWYSDKLIVGTAKGLSQMENGNFKPFHQEQKTPNSLLNQRITCLQRDGPSKLWIGTEKGLSCFNGNDLIHFPEDLTDENEMKGRNITALTIDEKGDLWIGSKDKGLSRHKAKSEVFEHFTAYPGDPQSLSSNTIHDIHCFLDFLWIGTPGGLNRMNRDAQTFQQYTKKSGLPGNTVYAIADNGKEDLWLSTNQGLCRMNPFTHTFRNYDVLDGLQSNRFSPGAAYQSFTGEIFFGGIGGLNTFYPKYVKDNSFPPKVSISRVQVPTLGKDVNFWNNSNLELNHQDKVIHFEFRALDFTLPEKNEFKVMMDPFDKEWTQPGSQRITYANLPPGSYVFRVKAANNDGIWSNENAEFRLSITPPFYRTWIAYLFYAFSTIFVCYALIKYNQQRERKDANRRLQETSKQMKLEADRAKQVFLANMSHELRTPLSAVIGYTELIQEEIADWSSEKTEQISPDLEKIKSSAFYQLSLVTNLLELSKLEAGQNELSLTTFDVLEEIKIMLSDFQAQLAATGNTFKLRVPHDVGVLKTDRIKLLEILMNLLSNANRFTRDGEITLMIRRLVTYRESKESKREWVTFVVKDTGIGMTDEEISQILDSLRNPLGRRKAKGPGLGLELCYRFSRMMNSEIDIDSEKGVGTRVTLRVPSDCSDC